jgi:hypothetical protein
VVALLERADQSVREESLRREAFDRALNDMKKMKGFEYEAPAAIARAKGLARRETELQSFSIERERLTLERMSDQETRDEPFRRERAAASSKVAEANSLSGRAKADALRDAAKRFDELLLRKGISETELKVTRTERDAALAEAATIEQAEDRQRELVVQLEPLPAAATSVASLMDAYDTLINRFPESPQALKLNEALAHRGAWQLIDSMNVMMRAWATSIIPSGKDECIARSIELEATLGKILNSPDAVAIGEYLEVIKHFSSQDEGPMEALKVTAVREMLERRWVSELQYTRDDAGRIFYTLGGVAKPIPGGFYTLTNHISKLDHLIDETPSDMSAILRVSAEPQLTDAPITKLGEELLKVLRSTDSSTLDSVHLRVAATIIRDQDTDPILRLMLISDVLNHHVRSGRPSDPLITRFARDVTNASIQGQKVIDMNWADTAGETTKRGREVAVNILQKAPDFSTILEAWAARRRDLANALNGFAPAGIVLPDSSGTMIVRFARTPRVGKFYVVTGDNNSATFIESGAVDSNGTILFNGGTPTAGTPVFMRQVITR